MHVYHRIFACQRITTLMPEVEYRLTVAWYRFVALGARGYGNYIPKPRLYGTAARRTSSVLGSRTALSTGYNIMRVDSSICLIRGQQDVV